MVGLYSKLKFITLLLIFYTISFSVKALSFEINGFSYEVLRSTTCQLTDVPDMETIQIPSIVEFDGNKYDVVAIGSDAFQNLELLKKIYIPSSIKTIKENFRNCKIEEVHIENIADWCEIEFTSIYSVPFRENDCNLFIENELITKVFIPEGVKKINPYSFCSSLIKEVTLSSSVEIIGANAFSSTKELETFNFASGLMTIEDEAFYYSNVTNLNFVYGLKKIGRAVFGDCINLKEVIFPESLETINGENTFFRCSNLQHVVLPKNLTVIPRTCFIECTSLEFINLPDNLYQISDYAFYNCSNLKEIIFPRNLSYIGKDAFNGCLRIDKIYSYNLYPPNVETTTFTGVDKNIELYVPFESIEVYKSTDIWNQFHNINGLNLVVVAQSIILNVNQLELELNDSFQMEAIVLPEDTTDKTVIWNSSDPSIATVNEDGLVKSVSLGIATITATCGEVTATCEITVIDDTGIESLFSDSERFIDIYSASGIIINKNAKQEALKSLDRGIYILKSKGKSYKIHLK